MSLMEQARTLFDTCNTRSEFIERAQSEIGLSRAGAATYWMNFVGKATHRSSPTVLIGRSNGNKPDTSGLLGQSPAVGLALFAAIF